MGGSGGVVRVLYLSDGDGGAFARHLDSVHEVEVTTAEDVSAELGARRDQQFDCVVGDVDDGLDVLSQVRSRRPHVPYLFVASEGADAADAALSRGATDYLERRADRDQRALLVARVEGVAARGRTAIGNDGRDEESESDTGDERDRIRNELRESETYLKRLYRTASDAESSFEERRRRLLELGRERLGVDIGFVSRIDSGTFEIEDAVGSHELLQPGETAPLSETYCRRAIDGEGLLSVRDAVSEGWRGDTAYETFGLGCYVGAKIVVDGDLYGTICFADREPRERSFTDSEMVYVELISQWISYELEQLADKRVLRQQNERLEEFASVLSHDLRNPLNVAEIYVNMAEQTGAAEDFDQVRQAHERMEQLIQNLLTLARQGELLDEVEPVDLAAVVEAAWTNVESDDSTLRTVDDPMVEADYERLEQLLENLFCNSVEHADHPVTVRVGALDGSRSDDPEDVGFYVEDDGPGIPEDERESVFEHGYSTDGGTGLGLAIVQQIAEAHDWQISITESEDGGARFEIRSA